MAEIISFPTREESRRQWFEKMIDEDLKLPDGALKSCFKERLSTFWSRKPPVPNLNLELPGSLTQEQRDELVTSLTAEYYQKMTEFEISLLSEIALLQFELCKREHEL